MSYVLEIVWGYTILEPFIRPSSQVVLSFGVFRVTVKMMRVVYPVMVLLVVLLQLCHVTLAIRWRSSLDNPSEKRCLTYMNECVPWRSKCCDGLSCTNLRKGHCVYPLELCVCQLKDSYNLDQNYFGKK